MLPSIENRDPLEDFVMTNRTANSQCLVAAGSRGRIHPAAPTPPRQALIDRVRLEIAGGTYETRAKIDALLPRLAEDLQFATHSAIEGGGRQEREKEPAHRRNALGG